MLRENELESKRRSHSFGLSPTSRPGSPSKPKSEGHLITDGPFSSLVRMTYFYLARRQALHEVLLNQRFKINIFQ